LSVNGLSVNGLSAVTTAAAAPACIGKPSKAAWASAAVELGDAVLDWTYDVCALDTAASGHCLVSACRTPRIACRRPRDCMLTALECILIATDCMLTALECILIATDCMLTAL